MSAPNFNNVRRKLVITVNRGHQGVWDLIRYLGRNEARFGRKDVMDQSIVHRKTTEQYFRRLVKAGIVQADPSAPEMFYIASDSGCEAPIISLKGALANIARGTHQMWMVMQMASGGFTARDLAVTASTEECRVSIKAARNYITSLKHAGYLDVLVKDQIGAKSNLATYALKRGLFTGPRAPVVRSVRVVWDPNLASFMGDATLAEGDENVS